MLNNVIIDINKINNGDSIDVFLNNTTKKVFTDLKEFSGIWEESFLITDSREKADCSKDMGIGYSLYLGENVKTEDFPDVLYCIESIQDMTDEVLERMYLRANNLPWTILETDRCIVREITLDDVNRLYEIYDNPVTSRFIEPLYKEKNQEIEFTKAYIENQYRFYEYGMWVAIDKETGKLIGRAGLSDRDGFDCTEIGFIFDADYHGKGYAYEVCSGILKYAREELGFNEIASFTHENNEKAKALLDRLGFKYIGIEKIEIGEYLLYKKDLTTDEH